MCHQIWAQQDDVWQNYLSFAYFSLRCDCERYKDRCLLCCILNGCVISRVKQVEIMTFCPAIAKETCLLTIFQINALIISSWSYLYCIERKHTVVKRMLVLNIMYLCLALSIGIWEIIFYPFMLHETLSMRGLHLCCMISLFLLC